MNAEFLLSLEDDEEVIVVPATCEVVLEVRKYPFELGTKYVYCAVTLDKTEIEDDMLTRNLKFMLHAIRKLQGSPILVGSEFRFGIHDTENADDS